MNHTARAFKKFISYTELNENECWEWKGDKGKDGYGRLEINNQVFKAHRMSYYFFIGVIPIGKVVMHTCDNSACINPSHLKLGTQKENVQDCIEKGRRGKVGAREKITERQVKEITNMYSSGKYTIKELSILYKVTTATIHRRIKESIIY